MSAPDRSGGARRSVRGFLPDDPEELALAGPGLVIPSGPPAGDVDAAFDTTTRYLGLPLTSPIVASASPLTGQLASLRALEHAGVGAVVLPSLFEEQIVHDSIETERMVSATRDVNPEASEGYVAGLDGYNSGVVHYLRHVRAAREELTVPVIASLNGVTTGGWTGYASMLADAGAHAIELNVYRVAADMEVSGRQVESETLALVEAVRRATDVPIAVKVSPYWSAFAHLARQLVEAGADGIVLFNRFYQPDIALETLSVSPHLVLSTSDELTLPLRWCAILRGRIDASLAATTGVHTGLDAAKLLLAGADVVMTTSALLRHGPEHVGAIAATLEEWARGKGYASVREMTGAMSQERTRDPAAFERANYLSTLTRYASTFLE
jgi:dihydroorotate dehydrogenase (fumarate)